MNLPRQMLADDDQIFDLAYERRQRRRADAVTDAESAAKIAVQEFTRSRRRTTWAEAIATRVAAGLVVGQ